MRIRTFCKFIEVNELEPIVLQNSTVVIDGMNFFCRCFVESQLPSQFGCESHRFANYLRKYLAMFKKANIKCYFVFKGGHQYVEDMEKVRDVSPIFMMDILTEVVHEMGFHYVTCEYESKKDIIELAQVLDCPVISYDIEFCFSGVQYIPSNELKYSERDNTIKCRYFLLEKYMDKYKYTVEKMALFIVLTDENIFPENFFLRFFERINAPVTWYQRNSRLLYWLSKNDIEKALKIVSQFVNAEEMKKFVEEVDKAQVMIGRRETGGIGAAYLLDRATVAVARNDPKWFPKGVAANHVPKTYINLHRFKQFYSPVSQDPVLVDPMFLSLEIVKYAYDLLTNFQNDGFMFEYDINDERESMIVSQKYSIRKPEYEASICVFENGWGEVRELGLFQHFLKESVRLVHLEPLNKLPEDAQLLMIALVYFSRKKQVDTSTEAVCVLLSYTTLSLVREKRGMNLPKPPFPSKPILDSTTDKSTVTDVDCSIAAAIIEEYLTVSDVDNEDILYDTLQPLKEFQYCLHQLNCLNLLCGAPFTRTVYSRTYAASMVFRLRLAVGSGGWKPFFDKLLGPASTVYAFLNGLIEVYETLLELN
ncbi:uncharacterized protein [Choristoneura fumiferana]|uniref:uncharacterized protein n=1 Tax=Choristoneura fumiferana TaxID=7141 RepID=UPI003D15CE00